MNPYRKPVKVTEPVSAPRLLGLVIMVLAYATLVMMLRLIFGIDNRSAT